MMRDPLRSFFLIVIVAFAVLVVEAWQIERTRTLAAENLQNKTSVAQLAKAQADSCQNFETLKAAVNDFQGTIRGLLASGIKVNTTRARNIANPKLKAADRSEVRRTKDLLAHTHVVTASCAQKKHHAVP